MGLKCYALNSEWMDDPDVSYLTVACTIEALAGAIEAGDALIASPTTVKKRFKKMKSRIRALLEKAKVKVKTLEAGFKQAEEKAKQEKAEREGNGNGDDQIPG